MIDNIQNWDADWDDVIDPSEPPEEEAFTECALCKCTPKPDEWSAQIQNVCIDCG